MKPDIVQGDTALKSHVNVRMSPETRRLLDEVCSLRGENPSTFVRRAVLRELAEMSFLSQRQKKALEREPGV